jgi:hypothetical protein
MDTRVTVTFLLVCFHREIIMAGQEIMADMHASDSIDAMATTAANRLEQ